jgi:hypothetical protein
MNRTLRVDILAGFRIEGFEDRPYDVPVVAAALEERS